MDYSNETDINNPTTAPEGATQTWETTKERASEALETGERYVRNNPIPSVLSVFGLGFVLGLLAGWCVAHQEEDDYRALTRKIVRDLKHKAHLD